MISRRLLVSGIALLSLSACIGDSTDFGNIAAEAVSVVTQDPRIAYPLKATISLQTDQARTNVPVSLSAIDSTNDLDEARQIPLGSVVIERVDAGTQDYDLEVMVPASVEFAGPYLLSAFVDPADIIIESNEDDNSVAIEIMLAVPAGPNVVLTDVALDRSALFINTDEYVLPSEDNTYNADAGGTITVGADGLALGESVEIEAFAALNIKRIDLGTSLNMPLYLWSTAMRRYTNAYGVQPETGALVDVEWLRMGQFTPLLAETAGNVAALNDVRRDSEHMEFYFPGRLGSELEEALRYPCTGVCAQSDPTIPPPDLTPAAVAELRSFLSNLPFSGVQGDESASLAALDFEICVKIRPTDRNLINSSTTDKEICRPIDIFLPPLPGQPPRYDISSYTPLYTVPSLVQETSGGFATRNDNPHFAFNVDFGAGDSADDRGYIFFVNADLLVEVFGNEFEFMGITQTAQLVPDYFNKPASEESGFTYEIRFLNQVIDSIPPITPGLGADNLPDPVKEKISYSGDGPKYEQQFFVGPVPMVAIGETAINYGLDFSVGYADDDPLLGTPILGSGNAVVSLGASVGPFVNLEAGLGIGVGIKGGVSAGVEGVLTLVDERLVYFIGADIEVIKDGFSNVDGNVEFIITKGQKLSNIFTGPRGALNLFLKYATFKRSTCKAGVVRYKCFKYDEEKKTLNLYTSPALFQREDVLWDKPSATIGVVRVSGKPTAYFTPQ